MQNQMNSRRPYSAAIPNKRTPPSINVGVNFISHQQSMHTKRSIKSPKTFIDQLDMVESQNSIQNNQQTNQLSFQNKTTIHTNNFMTDNQNGYDVMHKHLPKKILSDKEQLYEENLTLKQNYNKIKEDNYRIQTKYCHLQKEFLKLENQLVNNISHKKENNLNKRDQSNVELLKNFRITINEQENVIKEKIEEIVQLKKSIKYTSIKELQIEIKQYKEELNKYVKEREEYKYSQIKEENYEQMENKLFKCLSENKIMKEDNEKLSQIVMQLKQENNQEMKKHEHTKESEKHFQKKYNDLVEKYIKSEKNNWNIKNKIEEFKQKNEQQSKQLCQLVEEEDKRKNKKRIKRSEVEHILDLLKFNLIINNVERVDLGDIINQIVNERKKESGMKQLQEVMNSKPFELREEEQEMNLLWLYIEQRMKEEEEGSWISTCIQVIGEYDQTETYFNLNHQNVILNVQLEQSVIQQALQNLSHMDNKRMRLKLKALLRELELEIEEKHLEQFIIFYIICSRKVSHNNSCNSLIISEVPVLLAEYQLQITGDKEEEEYEGDFEDDQEIQAYQQEQEEQQRAMDTYQRDSLDQAILEEDEREQEEDNMHFEGSLLE